RQGGLSQPLALLCLIQREECRKQQGIAVCFSSRNGLCSDNAGPTRAVVDDNVLSQFARQGFSHHTSRQVAATAGRKGNHHPDGAFGPIGGPCGTAERKHGGEHRRHPMHFHHFTSSLLVQTTERRQSPVVAVLVQGKAPSL